MKRFFYLSTCSTCNRIMKELDLSQITLQDIKEENVTDFQIRRLEELTGSYESLFSRRAMKYKSMGLADKNLTEEDYKKLILDEYTFLKRPVLVVDDNVAVGNSKKAVEEMKAILNG